MHILSTRRFLAAATDRAERFRPILDDFAALPAAAVAAKLNAEDLMISRVQVEKIETMIKDGWTTVGRKPSDTDHTLGGPTLLMRNAEYVWVGADLRRGRTFPDAGDDGRLDGALPCPSADY